MAYPVTAVANAFLEIAREDGGKTITPLELQKLVYLAQGAALGAFGRDKPLFAERIEAWKYGPVVPVLYEKTKRYGSGPITSPIELPLADAFFRSPNIPYSDKKSWEIVKAVWDTYGHLSAPELVALTHRQDVPEGYPWYHAWIKQNGKDRPGTDIDDGLMEQEFKKVVTTI